MKIFIRTLIITLILCGAYFLKVKFFDTSYQNKILPPPPEVNTPKDIEAPISLNKKTEEYVNVYFLSSNGAFGGLKRKIEKPDLTYSIKQLLLGPTKYEKAKGYYSEIPSGTKLLSLTKTEGKIIINLSRDFETGGGTTSISNRLDQLVKTVNANSGPIPVYLFIEGKQVETLGGDGIMIEQPLKESPIDPS